MSIINTNLLTKNNNYGILSYMINKIKNILLGVGLNEKEADVLEYLFKSESSKVSNIAINCHLNRTTTYVILKSLIKKGLVSSSMKFGVTEFQAIEPNLLLSYIERQKELLDQKKTEIENILPELNNVRENLDVLPKVSFYQGDEGVKQAYEDTLDNNKSKKIYVFSGPDVVFKEMGKDYVDYYVNKRTRLGIQSFQIAPDTTWGKFIKENDEKYIRITKLIPAQFSFDTEMVIYDNKLGIFSFTKNKLMAVIIEDDSIVNTMLALFGYIDQTIKN